VVIPSEVVRAWLCTEGGSGTGSGPAPYTAADPSAWRGSPSECSVWAAGSPERVRERVSDTSLLFFFRHSLKPRHSPRAFTLQIKVNQVLELIWRQTILVSRTMPQQILPVWVCAGTAFTPNTITPLGSRHACGLCQRRWSPVAVEERANRQPAALGNGERRQSTQLAERPGL